MKDSPCAAGQENRAYNKRAAVVQKSNILIACHKKRGSQKGYLNAETAARRLIEIGRESRGLDGNRLIGYSDNPTDRQVIAAALAKLGFPDAQLFRWPSMASHHPAVPPLKTATAQQTSEQLAERSRKFGSHGWDRDAIADLQRKTSSAQETVALAWSMGLSGIRRPSENGRHAIVGQQTAHPDDVAASEVIKLARRVGLACVRPEAQSVGTSKVNADEAKDVLALARNVGLVGVRS